MFSLFRVEADILLVAESSLISLEEFRISLKMLLGTWSDGLNSGVSESLIWEGNLISSLVYTIEFG